MSRRCHGDGVVDILFQGLQHQTIFSFVKDFLPQLEKTYISRFSNEDWAVPAAIHKNISSLPLTVKQHYTK